MPFSTDGCPAVSAAAATIVGRRLTRSTTTILSFARLTESTTPKCSYKYWKGITFWKFCQITRTMCTTQPAFGARIEYGLSHPGATHHRQQLCSHRLLEAILLLQPCATPTGVQTRYLQKATAHDVGLDTVLTTSARGAGSSLHGWNQYTMATVRSNRRTTKAATSATACPHNPLLTLQFDLVGMCDAAAVCSLGLLPPLLAQPLGQVAGQGGLALPWAPLEHHVALPRKGLQGLRQLRLPPKHALRHRCGDRAAHLLHAALVTFGKTAPV
jgi:hypothetical protein